MATIEEVFDLESISLDPDFTATLSPSLVEPITTPDTTLGTLQEGAITSEEQLAELQEQLIPLILKDFGLIKEDGTIREMTPEETQSSLSEGEQFQQAFGRSQQESILLSQGFRFNPETGEVERLSEAEILESMTPIERGNFELTGSIQTALNNAISGNFVDPILEQQIAEEETVLTESIARQVGPRGEFSTPGIQKRESFERGAAFRRETAKSQEIGRLGSLLFGVQGGTRADIGTRAGLTGLSEGILGSLQTPISDFQSLAGFRGLTPGTAQLLNLGQQQAENVTSTELFREGLGVSKDIARQQLIGDILGSGGSALAAYLIGG